ncbi:MAG: vanadium-dependent haloperoxidase, partial [Gillisia sp.]
DAVDKSTVVMVHDIFSPPQVSRIYAYPNVAAYEIIASHNPKYKTLVGQIKELTPIPKPKDTTHLNYNLAALMAHLEISKGLIFSEDWIQSYQDSLYTKWKKVNPEEFQTSKSYAMQVVKHIEKWMGHDNYKETRTMSKFTVISDDPGRWQPTPPAYMDGIEPHWNKIRTFVIKTADQFKPAPPPPFSMDKNSEYYKQLMEVYNVKLEMNKEGDEGEKLAIAQFWNCNPYVSVNVGHLMFAKKKITPGAHWIGITKIACEKTNADFDKTVMAYTASSITLADAFISCWDEKYRSNMIRPETVINKYLDENWMPALQTPPFPEYTSGHSVASGAAGIVLTSIFGDNFSFDDDTETPYALPVRWYKSFNDASAEAAVSRLYGGIHYRASIYEGLKEGRDLGAYVVQNLHLTENTNDLAAE